MVTTIERIKGSRLVVSNSPGSFTLGEEGEPTESMEPSLAGTSGFDNVDPLAGRSQFDLNGETYEGDEFELGTARMIVFYGWNAVDSDPTVIAPVAKAVFHSYNGSETDDGAEPLEPHKEAFIMIYSNSATMFSVPKEFTIGGEGKLARCIYVDPETDEPLVGPLSEFPFVRSVLGSRCLTNDEALLKDPVDSDNLNDLVDPNQTVTTQSTMKLSSSSGCTTCGFN